MECMADNVAKEVQWQGKKIITHAGNFGTNIIDRETAFAQTPLITWDKLLIRSILPSEICFKHVENVEFAARRYSDGHGNKQH